MGGRGRQSTLALAAIAVALAGCGDDGPGPGSCKKNGAPGKDGCRPAVPIVITAYISANRITVSPAKLGAGPASIIVTNQGPTSRQLRLTDSQTTGDPCRSAGSGACSGAINPMGVTKVQVDLRDGTYRLKAGNGIVGATLTVKGIRPSAQNDVLLP